LASSSQIHGTFRHFVYRVTLTSWKPYQKPFKPPANKAVYSPFIHFLAFCSLSSPVSTTMKKALISLRNRGFFFYAFEICAQNSRGVVLSFPAVIIKK